MALKILLVDDHALVRDALRERLDRESSLRVVGSASDAAQAIDLADELQPDIILLDIDMPGLISFDAARSIMKAHPDIRIIFLSAYVHDHYVDQALQVGALGYVTKAEPPEKVVAAILEVAANRAYFSDGVRARIVLGSDKVRLAPHHRSRASVMTPRERETLGYIARGLTKREIAEIMDVSMKTVDKHTEHLMQKLDIHNRVQLARFAIREGLAKP